MKMNRWDVAQRQFITAAVLSRRNLNLQPHRAMIASVNLPIYRSALDLVDQRLAYKEVVDAPPGIRVARVESITPPRIRTFEIRMKTAERVHESGIE